MRATVVQSTCQSEKCKKLAASTLLEVEMSKKCTALWRDAQFEVKQSKRTKHTIVGTLLEVEMLKQCAALWREVRFQVRMLKRNMLGPLLDIKRFLFLKAGAMDSAPREK